jgi:hypothetical protein
VVPFIRYPYRLFYRIADDVVEVLHIHTVLGRSRGSVTIGHERCMAFCAPHPIMRLPVHY